jgi:hypothetical protein
MRAECLLRQAEFAGRTVPESSGIAARISGLCQDLSEDEDGAGEDGQVLPRDVDLNVPYTNTDAERVNNVTGDAGETFAMPVRNASSANPATSLVRVLSNPHFFAGLDRLQARTFARRGRIRA